MCVCLCAREREGRGREREREREGGMEREREMESALYLEARSFRADIVFIACENAWLAVMLYAPGSRLTLRERSEGWER